MSKYINKIKNIFSPKAQELAILAAKAAADDAVLALEKIVVKKKAAVKKAPAKKVPAKKAK